MKRFFALFIATVMLCLCFTSCSGKATNIDGVIYSNKKTNYVLMSVKDYGDIVIELYADKAPFTVENFQNLVDEKFYDGLTFHRIISEFMIQGGDPKGDGTGGASKNIIGEFAANGINTGLKHTRGVISMARGGYSYNSASSQFFIVHKTSINNTLSLDGNYAAFGKVIYGMDVVDAIAAVETGANDRPLETVTISSIRFVTLSNSFVPEEIM